MSVAKMISIKGVLSFVGCFCFCSLSSMDKFQKQVGKQKKYEAKQKQYAAFIQKLRQFGITDEKGKVCGFYQPIDRSSKYVQYMRKNDSEEHKIEAAKMILFMQAKL